MIKLWDGYYITADQYQYILARVVVESRQGRSETRLRGATYHPNLRSAAEAFARARHREMIEQDDMSLSQAIAAYSAICDRLVALIGEA